MFGRSDDSGHVFFINLETGRTFPVLQEPPPHRTMCTGFQFVSDHAAFSFGLDQHLRAWTYSEPFNDNAASAASATQDEDGHGWKVGQDIRPSRKQF